MTSRSRTFVGFLLALGTTAACGGEGGFDAWCNTPGREVTLLFYCLPPSVLAIVVGWGVRARQLRNWDLRESAAAPSSWATVGVFLALFVVAGLLLSFALNGADGCAPEQRSMNLRYAWAGIVIATVLCLVGPLGANWLYGRRQ